jgi:hypothetical protein
MVLNIALNRYAVAKMCKVQTITKPIKERLSTEQLIQNSLAESLHSARTAAGPVF